MIKLKKLNGRKIQVFLEAGRAMRKCLHAARRKWEICGWCPFNFC